MATLPFLTHTTDIYDKHVNAWKREERRLYGGDAVINDTELLRWKGEESEFYDSRLGQAGYITLPKLHVGTLVGHLSRETPIPNFAELGRVRKREELRGTPSFAELIWYNVGIGSDGEELLPWLDGVNERALATGFRWILVELPSRATLTEIRQTGGRADEGPVTLQDVLDGFRPYPVEISPIDVPFWQISNKRLDFANIRIKLVPTNLLDESLNVKTGTNGSYLLVRKGFSGLGATYARGGWWKYAESGELVDNGDWEQTQGQIPLFPFIGESSPGTSELPAIGRSLTMELGQIAVSLMNRISERNWNMMQAAKSENWIMGIKADEHAKVIKQQDLGSITIGVPPVLLDDGRVGIPTMWNSSAALLDASAFEMVIKSGLEEAREIMVKQVTSTPDSSGRSKEAGFAEATSPLLARLASTRQQAINSLLYFMALRFGIANPTANVQIKRDFRLAPVLTDVDDMMLALKRSWLRSPSWEKFLLIKRGEEAGMLPENRAERQTIVAELEDSAQVATEPASQLEDDNPDTPGRKPVQATPTQPQAA